MTQNDWLSILKPLTDARWTWNPHGRIEAPQVALVPELNWIYQHVLFDCTEWNAIFHNIVAKKTMVHSHCHNCIKIVAKPKTLRQLVKIEAIQAKMLYPCKCGIDMRDNTSVIYGAFWYNRGFQEARDRYKHIRKMFNKNGLRSVPLIIKKACTEFENAMGPTDKWKPPTPEQLALEKDLVDHMDYLPTSPNCTKEAWIIRTHIKWVQWAYEHGDETYLDFTNGVPIHQPLVTYDPEGTDE